jgi:hypothetical protein
METSKKEEEDSINTSKLEPWNISDDKFPFEGSNYDKSGYVETTLLSHKSIKAL